MTRLAPAVAGLAAVVLLGGCGSSGADKAGGSHAPAVLRLGVVDTVDQPGAADVRYFADQVGRLSHGKVRVDVVFAAAGQDVAAIEPRLARMVRSGRYQLGWVGARAWDQLGVKSMQALQAPFLIDDQALLQKVTTSSLAEQMLTGLRGAGVEGLALVPNELRYVFGHDHPFVSLRDFAGASVRVNPSGATDALLRALGAVPEHMPNATGGTPAQQARIQAGEAGISNAAGAWLTINEPLFAKAFTLFANRSALARLSSDQRDAVRRAAAMTVRDAVSRAVPADELVRRFCEAGRIATADTADKASLERAAQPVYAQFERDTDTKTLIDAIRQLKSTLPVARVPAVPDRCRRPAGSAAGAAGDPSVLDGTYRWRVTQAGASSVGAPPHDPDVGTLGTMTLRGGRWSLGGEDNDHGTFKIAGDRLVFDWPRVGAVLSFTFKRRHDGSLDLRPVLPMDIGDRVIWSSERWRRIGPPVRAIP